MRAAVFHRFGQPPEIQDVDAPVCPPSGAVVRVGATGVCRSDWHAWQGHDETVALPHVGGHEFAGTVDEVGRHVNRQWIGARVTTPFVCACGDCQQCRDGDHQVCSRQTQPGFTHWGSFAERVVVHNADVNLVRLPDGMHFVAAASLGCRFATAFRAVTVHGQVQPGQWVSVHGCGGVGLSAVMVARARGARVVAVDTSAPAREAAEALGADATLDPRAESAAAVGASIREITGGGAHVSLDAVGSASTCAASIEGLRPRGRHVQVGLLTGDQTVAVTTLRRLISQELMMLGSHGMAAADYPQLLAMVSSGALQPARLVGQVIGLDGLGSALSEMSIGPSGAGLTVVRLDANALTSHRSLDM